MGHFNENEHLFINKNSSIVIDLEKLQSKIMLILNLHEHNYSNYYEHKYF